MTKRPPTSAFRKQPGLQVKLDACLLMLGFTKEEIATGQIRWDHDPALGLRRVTDGVMDPAPNDPAYLKPMRIKPHKEKTIGRGATTYGSDSHAIAKTKRLEKELSFVASALALMAGDPRAENLISRRVRRRWPKRSFEKRR